MTRSTLEAATPDAPLTHRSVLAVAVPIMASNVSEPLIGIVDTAVLGQLGAAYYIGAISVGAMIFSFLFWAFGFLRMGTSGLTAQAAGARDNDEIRAALGRALLIAGLMGTALIVLGPLLSLVAFHLIEASAEVENHARTYFDIRIWSAPAALANYAFLGWFIGMGKAHLAFLLQLVLNAANAALDALFVLVLELDVVGVALGTVLAQVGAAALGCLLVARDLEGRGGHWNWQAIRAPERLRRTIAVNSDIMVRSLCLLFAFAWFTAQGARSGDVVLAANAVLYSMLMFNAYLLDGFAFAAETLVGQSVGARDADRFSRAVRLSSAWAAVVGFGLGAAIWLGGGLVIDLLTVNAAVRETARTYLGWAALTPAVGFVCFQLDGIFIGATRTADMRNMMIVSLAVYLAMWALLAPIYGNHGLWMALVVFFVVRGVTLGLRYPALVRDSFGAAGLTRGTAAGE